MVQAQNILNNTRVNSQGRDIIKVVIFSMLCLSASHMLQTLHIIFISHIYVKNLSIDYDVNIFVFIDFISRIICNHFDIIFLGI